MQEISKPVTCHRFGSPDMDDIDEDAGSYFISAVCWKSDSPTMLTANSQGTIKVLILAAWIKLEKGKWGNLIGELSLKLSLNTCIDIIEVVK